MSLDQLVISDDSVNRIKDAITAREIDVKDIDAILEDKQRRLKLREEEAKFYSFLVDHHEKIDCPIIFHRRIKAEIELFRMRRDDYLSKVRSISNSMREYEEVRQSHLEHIKDLTEEYNKKKGAPPEILKWDDVDKSLSGTPEYVLGSLNMFTDDRDAWISFVLSGITCTPDRNPYSNIVGDGSFPLKPVRISVKVSTGKVLIDYADSSDARVSPRGYNDSTPPHPHVLDRSTPCLGDFEANIHECMEDRDFTDLSAIIVLFLEQAYDGDSAGKLWPRWLMANLMNENELLENNRLHRFRPIEIEDGKRIYTNKYEGSDYKYRYNTPFYDGEKLVLLDRSYKSTRERLDKFMKHGTVGGMLARLKKTAPPETGSVSGGDGETDSNPTLVEVHDDLQITPLSPQTRGTAEDRDVEQDELQRAWADLGRYMLGS